MSSPVPPPPTEPPQGPPPVAPPPSSVAPAGDPAQMIKIPAMGLVVTGGLMVLGQVVGLFMNILGLGMSSMEDFSEFPIEGMEKFAPFMTGTWAIVSAFIGLAIGAFVLFGAMQMLKLKGYGLAITTCVVAMLPCSCCCIVGLVFGIWGLVILLKPEVKAAFS